MEQMIERCAAIDVHKTMCAACTIIPEQTETVMVGTMTRQLEQMIDDFEKKGITHVAMESTGSYWKPIYNLLEQRGFEVILVNARHFKNVPGRKTDIQDAQWLAQLLQMGLLRASYVPSRDQRELRELTRYRRSLIEEQTREVNRIQKVLEGANIKLGDVATDIMGKSGRAMLRAIANGEDNPETLVKLARGKLKKKVPELKEALHGTIGLHQRMMLKMQLEHIDALENNIASVDQEVAKRMRPLDELIERIDEIPGVGRRTVEEILAEIGVDMSRFPTSKHLASWAGMCPGNNSSAGKRQSGRTSPGNTHLRRSLIQSATCAARTRGTYLSAQYKRIAARRGAKRAAVAVGHTILTSIYYLIRDGVEYVDLGHEYLDRIQEKQTVTNAVKRLQALGYEVDLQRKNAA